MVLAGERGTTYDDGNSCVPTLIGLKVNDRKKTLPLPAEHCTKVPTIRDVNVVAYALLEDDDDVASYPIHHQETFRTQLSHLGKERRRPIPHISSSHPTL